MPRPLGGALSCLTSVCLSRTSGLSREQRGPGRLKLAQRLARDSDTTFKVKFTGDGGILWRSPESLQLVHGCVDVITGSALRNKLSSVVFVVMI